MGRNLVDIEAFPMLRVCSAAGCSKVVFGGGTCIDHDARDEVWCGPSARTEPTVVPRRADAAVAVFVGIDS